MMEEKNRTRYSLRIAPKNDALVPLSDCKANTKRFQAQYIPIRAVFLPLNFKSPLLFLYKLNTKLKLF